MQVNKTAIAVFIMGCLIFSVQAQCVVSVVITPSDVNLPDFVGDIFSFDFVVSDAMSTNATGFQSYISISRPGLTVDNETNSLALEVADETDYWCGHSGNTDVKVDDGNFVFVDYTTSAEPLADKIMARYAFKWGGAPDEYMFTLDIIKSYVLLDDFFSKKALQFPSGSNSFTVTIPEPCTLVIFVLGTSAVLLKRRGK